MWVVASLNSLLVPESETHLTSEVCEHHRVKVCSESWRVTSKGCWHWVRGRVLMRALLRTGSVKWFFALKGSS